MESSVLKSNWRNLNVHRGTVFDTLNTNFRTHPAAIPSFEGFKSIMIGSDYSGESQDEPYFVYSLLITGDEAWAGWEKNRIQLRKQLMPDNRRMAYKKLGDKYRRQFLKPIL